MPGQEPAPETHHLQRQRLRRSEAASLEVLPIGTLAEARGAGALFGHHAALACHLANESYFRGPGAVGRMPRRRSSPWHRTPTADQDAQVVETALDSRPDGSCRHVSATAWFRAAAVAGLLIQTEFRFGTRPKLRWPLGSDPESPERRVALMDRDHARRAGSSKRGSPAAGATRVHCRRSKSRTARLTFVSPKEEEGSKTDLVFEGQA